jgi:hypothetical protein
VHGLGQVTEGRVIAANEVEAVGNEQRVDVREDFLVGQEDRGQLCEEELGPMKERARAKKQLENKKNEIGF